jgi:hypothetical protein
MCSPRIIISKKIKKNKKEAFLFENDFNKAFYRFLT